MKTLLLRRKIKKLSDLEFLNNPGVEKRLILGLIILILILAVTYGYFVKQIILNVITREQTEEKIVDLGSHVGDLEVRYIELKNHINLEFAYSLGYNEIPEVKFVSRSTLDKILTLNSQ